MARTIEQIQQGIITSLNPAGNNLSNSKVAEWRLFTYVIATAIHAFEVVLDIFRKEIEDKAYTITAGTVAWYAEMCRQFQYGHTLVYNTKTANYDYKVVDHSARIIKMVAVNERECETVIDGVVYVKRELYIKVATQDTEGKMIPLSDAQRQDFIAYMKKKEVAGTSTVIITTTADIIRYNIEVFYDPAYPQQTIRDGVLAAFENYKISLSFDAKFYPQRLIDKIMSVEGVVTVDPKIIEHKTSEDNAIFKEVKVVTELASGYFEYDKKNNTLTLTTTAEQ